MKLCDTALTRVCLCAPLTVEQSFSLASLMFALSLSNSGNEVANTGKATSSNGTESNLLLLICCSHYVVRSRMDGGWWVLGCIPSSVGNTTSCLGILTDDYHWVVLTCAWVIEGHKLLGGS